MSDIKILVVEDELITAMQIKNSLHYFGYEVVNAVTNYQDAIMVLENDNIDIAILDINLVGEKTGIDVAQYINKNIKIPFIFLTINSSKETIDLVKRLHPPAFLVKPFKREDLYTSIELALFNYHSSKPDLKSENFDSLNTEDAFFIKDNYRFKKINFHEIVYAQSDHVYMKLIKTNEKNFLYRSTMHDLLETLPNNFMQVHRSFLINLNYLESFDSDSVVVNGNKIPVSKQYKSKLLLRIA